MLYENPFDEFYHYVGAGFRVFIFNNTFVQKSNQSRPKKSARIEYDGNHYFLFVFDSWVELFHFKRS